MALYSDKVMDHFLKPRNLGVIENADGVGEVGNAKCGDIMKMYLKLRLCQRDRVQLDGNGAHQGSARGGRHAAHQQSRCRSARRLACLQNALLRARRGSDSGGAGGLSIETGTGVILILILKPNSTFPHQNFRKPQKKCGIEEIKILIKYEICSLSSTPSAVA